jgi:hypothetical protein
VKTLPTNREAIAPREDDRRAVMTRRSFENLTKAKDDFRMAFSAKGTSG